MRYIRLFYVLEEQPVLRTIQSDDLKYLLEEGGSGPIGEDFLSLLSSTLSMGVIVGNLHPTRVQADLLCKIHFRSIHTFVKCTSHAFNKRLQ